MKYIEEHPDEDATATLIVYVGYEQVLPTIAKLTPEVRNGRMKSDLDSLERMFKQVLKSAAARKAVVLNAYLGETADFYQYLDSAL